MSVTYSPMPPVEIVTVLTATASHCEIHKNQSDYEAGDPVEVTCGATTRLIGWALKGVMVDRIRPCRVILTLNAVHFPRLLDLNNCHGSLTAVDVGGIWTKILKELAAIKSERIEFVSYKRLAKKIGCYKVNITYDDKSSAHDTTYSEKSGEFCIPKQ